MIKEIKEYLKESTSLMFITGAGISVASGIPTYRGIGGLYNQPMEDGTLIEDFLTAKTLKKNPAALIKYLKEITNLITNALPNKAHKIISDLQDKYEVTVVTQNIDDLHNKAGSKNVIELHGNIFNYKCNFCELHRETKNILLFGNKCNNCNIGIIRPDVVLFGENLNPSTYLRFQHPFSRGIDMIFVIGTSSLFSYIVDPILHAIDCGIIVIEINPEDTYLSNKVQYKLSMKAEEALFEIFERK